MKTVKITKPFTAYPAGKRTSYRKDDEPTVANADADVWIGKGLATEVKPPAPKPDAKSSD